MEITEKELHKIIKEEVKKILLKEFATPRKIYIDNIQSHFQQIVENWVLIHFCSILNNDINNCKNHWKEELLTHLSKCGQYKLKGNNSFNNRLKAINTAESYEELLTDKKIAYYSISHKFRKEEIDINKYKEEYVQCINDLINNKNDILYLIAHWDGDEEMIDYINKI